MRKNTAAKDFRHNALETAKWMTKLTGITDKRTIYSLPTHLLYLNTAGAKNYSTARHESAEYRDGLHLELIALMKKCSRELLERGPASVQPRRLELVDLGPGEFPDKTQDLMEAAQQSGVEVIYVPVDMSDYYLTKLETAWQTLKTGVLFHRIQAMFQNVDAQQLIDQGYTRPYIHLGPTYMSYSPDEVTGFLAKMRPPDGCVIVSTELISATNSPEAICARYNTPEGIQFVFGSLANLGCPRDHFAAEVNYNPALSRVEFVFECVKATKLRYTCLGGEQVIFKPGDRIMTATSYRATYQQFADDTARGFGEREIFVSPSGHTAMAVCGLH